LDNSANSLKQAEELVRTAMEDGIHTIVCSPRMGPMSQWSIPAIRKRFFRFLTHIQESGFPITLKLGADIDFHEDLAKSIQSGQLLTINNSRYFLLRLTRESVPAQLEYEIDVCIEKGFVPIITHPERLNWVSHHYHRVIDLVKKGAWLQITGDSLTGHMGRLPKYWSERLLDEGWVHVIATDAHATDKREPLLSDAYHKAIHMVGDEEAEQLVEIRPLGVLENQDPSDILAPLALRKIKKERQFISA
jgi:protein-tyrosine phosphatase